MKITVLFFGVLSEVAETGTKFYSDVKNVEDLKNRLSDDYPAIVHYSYRVSVNNGITDDNRLLADGDEIALLPPFAGG
jgi:molybdopterin converting factor small subunit